MRIDTDHCSLSIIPLADRDYNPLAYTFRRVHRRQPRTTTLPQAADVIETDFYMDGSADGIGRFSGQKFGHATATTIDRPVICRRVRAEEVVGKSAVRSLVAYRLRVGRLHTLLHHHQMDAAAGQRDHY